MSRDRCLSLDRAMRRQQEKQMVHQSGGYMPESSPHRFAHRSPMRSPACPYSPHGSPSTPEILRTSFPSRLLNEFSLDEFEVCPSPKKLPRSKQLQYEHDYQYDTSLEAKERQAQFSTRRAHQLEELPDDYLEDYVEPSFYEPAAHSSFDEVMCILASPPQREQLVEPEVMSAKLPRKEGPQTPIVERTQPQTQTPTRRYKIPPLSEDPYDIPPHPKDPKDVVGLIRRARAIERLKALEAAAKPVTKGAVRRGSRASLLAQKTAASARRLATPQASGRLAAARQAKPQLKKKLVQPPKSAAAVRALEHPPDYVAPEYAAAILRARKLAGLKTTNPKLLAKISKQAPQPLPRAPTTPQPSLRIPGPATYASIMERAAAIRARAAADGKQYRQSMAAGICPVTPKDSVTTMPLQAAAESPLFEAPPVIRLHDLKKRREAMSATVASVIPQECRTPEYGYEILKKFDDLADWTLGDISGPQEVCTRPQAFGRSAVHPSSTLDDTMLNDMEMPDFDVGDESVCPREYDLTHADAIELEDITMLEDENISLDELALEDITSPELDDLSISLPKGLEPDYTLELSDEPDDVGHLKISDEQQKSPGFLTTVVSAVVDKFRNIFGATPKEGDEDEDEQDRCIRLDSSLPNLFEATPSQPPPRTAKPSPKEELTIIPKYPKEYIAMVKKAQLIHKQKAQEAAAAAAAKGRRKGVVPRRAPLGGPPGKKQTELPVKIYPPGEYSPKYAAAVARARTLAGYKNRSAILNPERAAKIAALKAAKESELAAEEALPPVERMRKRMARLQHKGKHICPRPSIEALGALEAIRANLPRPEMPSLPKPKWTPAIRRRLDRSLFIKSPTRAFGDIEPMTPLKEESFVESDLMKFSPLRPHEGKLRLEYLQQEAKRTAQDGCSRTPQRDYPEMERPQTPVSIPVKYSPIRLCSPGSPRSEEICKETVTTNVGENGGEESIREEVTETSTIENGAVHTTTRKVTTKTDEFGNVTSHIEEGTGITAEGDAIDDIEAPEFLNISDIPPHRDPSIPTPSQIIDRIRSQVQAKLNLVLPQVSADIERPPPPVTPGVIEFPQDLPEDQLYDVDIPEFDTTPVVQHELEGSRDISLPHCWGEAPPSSHPQTAATTVPTSTKVLSPVQAPTHTTPQPRPKSPKEGPVIIPPFPKDPKDYVAIVKIAQAIHKRKQQEAAAAAALAPSLSAAATPKKPVRVPVSRRLTKTAGRQVLSKKNYKKPEPQLTHQLEDTTERECPKEPPTLPSDYTAAVARARQLAGYKNRTAALNPELAARVAAKKAAEEAAIAEYEALPEYQKILKRMEKVRIFPQRKRSIQPTIDMIGTLEAIRANLPPAEEVCQVPRAPITGMVLQAPEQQAVVQATEEVESAVCPTSPPPICEFESPRKKLGGKTQPTRDESLDEFEALKREIMAADDDRNAYLDSFEARKRRLMTAEQSRNESLDEFEALEREMMAVEDSRNAYPDSFEARKRRMMTAEQFRNESLDEFEALEREIMAAEDSRNAYLNSFEGRKRRLTTLEQSRNKSLDEFEALEREMMADENSRNANLNSFEARKKRMMTAEQSHNESLDEFEALEREMMAADDVRNAYLDSFEARKRRMMTAEQSRNESLDEFEALEREMMAAEDSTNASLNMIEACKRKMMAAEQFRNESLDEFEAFEREMMAMEHSRDMSLYEFEALEREMRAAPQTPAECEIVPQTHLHSRSGTKKRIDELKIQLLDSDDAGAESNICDVKENPMQKRIAELKRQLLGTGTPAVEATADMAENAMQNRIAELKVQLLGSEAPAVEAATEKAENAIQKRIAELKMQLLESEEAATEVAAETTLPNIKENALQNRIAELQMQLFDSGKSQLPTVDVTPQMDEYALDRRIAELKLKLLGSVEIPKKSKTAQVGNILQECTDAGDRQLLSIPADNRDLYKGIVAEFGHAKETVGLCGPSSAYNLMPSTPEDPITRLRRIKEAQLRPCPLEETFREEQKTISSPLPIYIPIPFSSPSEGQRSVAATEISPVQATDDQLLVDLQTPQKMLRPKRFVDLVDMPFDELEFEDEPSLVNASLEKHMTPPPQPSELINRIRQQVHERLRQDALLHSQIPSPGILQLPQELPEEELLDMSAPTFVHTPRRKSLPQPPVTPTPRAKSPMRKSIPSFQPEVIECPKVAQPEKAVEDIYRPKYPKGYVEMVKKAQALHKLKLQQVAENAVSAPPSEPTKRKCRVAATKVGGKCPVKKGMVRPPKIVKKKEKPVFEADETRECPTEPPPLPPDYLAAVARARQLAGYKNRTAALNPQVAARIAQEKADAEASAAAYSALPEHEKIKIRMERLRSKKGGVRKRIQPTIEQQAFIQHMKDTSAYKTASRSPSAADKATERKVCPSQRVSLTPRATATSTEDSPGLAEFEALEKLEAQYDLLDEEQPPDFGYESVTEPAAPDQCQLIADAQWQLLATPPRIDPRERFKRILAQAQVKPPTPAPPSPIQTPDIHYSPVRFPASPTSPDRGQRSEKTTTQITRSGDNTIKERVTETSENINGELQRVTEHVSTTTEPSGKVTCQINESRQIKAKDSSAFGEQLEDIEEPSYLDTTPVTPTGAPRPRDIIERIRKIVKIKPRPHVPTGRLIELRTPPRELPLPQEVVEEQLLEMSCPALAITPPRSSIKSPRISPVRSQDISIPEMFAATPPPLTPPLPPVSPLRHRVHSPEGPIVIPPYPKDPTDYAAMVRMSRKINELKLQKEAEAKAAAEAAAIKASKPKEKVRVPISKWTAPPAKKPGTRKRLVMRKRAPVAEKTALVEPARECPTEPPPLPEGYAEAVARARQLAGLRSTTSVLNPEYAAREAARLEEERARIAILNAPATYCNLMAKFAAIREHGRRPQVQPSLEAAAYLNAVKNVMKVTQQPVSVCPSGTSIRTPPAKRYERIIAARTLPYRPPEEEVDLETTPIICDVPYIPVRLESPREEYSAGVGFNIRGLENVGDLGEVQEPSFFEISQTPTKEGEYMMVSHRTPQPTPSGIIRRIREEVKQKLAAERLNYSMYSTPPAALCFPTDLPEEELMELSAPSFEKTPQRQLDSPIRSPDVSIPRYFEESPSVTKDVTPNKTTPRASSPQIPHSAAVASPPLLGIHPGLRVKTPEGPLVRPPHPKGREDVVAMIRRAQLIHKLKLKEDAAKSDARLVNRRGVRVPASRRPSRPATKLLKVAKTGVKPKMALELQRTEECPAESPELPTDYVAAVARARRLAGLKNTKALLNPPQDYDTIMTRVAALKAGRGEIEPSPKQLQASQNIIRRPRRVEKELLTPRPALERYRALNSRAAAETPTTSQVPYSPVSTPDTYHVPTYQPIRLRSTPPFYQNINISDIADTSMPLGGNDDTDIGDIPMPIDVYDYDYGVEVNDIEDDRESPVFSKSLTEFEAMERMCQETVPSESLTEFEVIERMCQEPEPSESLTEFEAMERMCQEPVPSESLTEFEAMERLCQEPVPSASLAEFEAMERMCQVLAPSESLTEFEAIEKLCHEPKLSASLKESGGMGGICHESRRR